MWVGSHCPRSSLIWICTVFHGSSVPKLSIAMVILPNFFRFLSYTQTATTTWTSQQSMTKQRVKIPREIKTYQRSDSTLIARLLEMMKLTSVRVRVHRRLSEELWFEMSEVAGFPPRPTQQVVQPKKMAGDLKFWI